MSAVDIAQAVTVPSSALLMKFHYRYGVGGMNNGDNDTPAWRAANFNIGTTENFHEAADRIFDLVKLGNGIQALSAQEGYSNSAALARAVGGPDPIGGGTSLTAGARFNSWFNLGAVNPTTGASLNLSDRVEGGRQGAGFGGFNTSADYIAPSADALYTSWATAKATNLSLLFTGPVAAVDALQAEMGADGGASAVEAKVLARITAGLNADALNTTAMATLTNNYLVTVLADINTQLQLSLALDIPDVQAQMEASGLSRSGAGTLAVGALILDATGKANQAKIAAIAQFQEARLNSVADAVKISMSNAGQLQGAAVNQIGAAASTWQQLQGEMFGTQLTQSESRFLGNQQNMGTFNLNMGDLQLKRQQGERQMGENAFNQMISFYGAQEQNVSAAMSSLSGAGLSERDLAQQRLNQQMEFGMIPITQMYQLATGVTGTPLGNYGRVEPWTQMGANVAEKAAGQLIGPTASAIYSGS